MNDILNRQTIEQLKIVMGEDAPAVIGDLIQTMQEEGAKQLAAIKTGIAEKDLESVRVKAHALKGSAGNIGADKLSETSSEMEILAQEGDLTGVQTLFEQLIQDFKEAMDALQRLDLE